MDFLMEYMARGFVVMLIISMPCVLVAALIGLVIGILQAVTQVQEQTIAAAPKILAVFLVVIICGYGYVKLLSNLTTDGFAIAFNVVPKNESYVLPSDYYRYTRPFAGEMNDKLKDKGKIKELMQNTSKAEFSKLNGEKMQYLRSPGTSSVKPSVVESKKIMGR